MSEIKEFSDLNGYLLEDAVARAEIKTLKEQMQSAGGVAGGGKLYEHNIVIVGYQDDGVDRYDRCIWKFSFLSSSADKIAMGTSGEFFDDTFGKIGKGRYLGSYREFEEYGYSTIKYIKGIIDGGDSPYWLVSGSNANESDADYSEFLAYYEDMGMSVGSKFLNKFEFYEMDDDVKEK